MQTTSEKLAYDISGAGKALGNVSRRTIYRLAAEGKIRIKKVGSRSIIPASDLRALLEDDAA